MEQRRANSAIQICCPHAYARVGSVAPSQNPGLLIDQKHGRPAVLSGFGDHQTRFPNFRLPPTRLLNPTPISEQTFACTSLTEKKMTQNASQQSPAPPIPYTDTPWSPIPLPPNYSPLKDSSNDPAAHIAADMILVHNILIRALNSLHINAALIVSDNGLCDFLSYTMQVLKAIHDHDKTEDTIMFPAFQHIVDMQRNVEQHQTFEKEMDVFELYVCSIQAGQANFEVGIWRELLRKFATPLVVHLNEEVLCHMIVNSTAHLLSLQITTLNANAMAQVDRSVFDKVQKEMVDYAAANGSVLKDLPFFLTAHKRSDNPNWVRLLHVLYTSAKS